MNILALGAHFDDLELGCGGSLAKHVYNGDNVYAFVATNSGYSNTKNIKIRSSLVAKKEGLLGLNTLGVKNITFGNINTFKLEFNESLNKKIIKILEKYEIDMVYTHWDGDVHHDHLSLAQSSIHCCKHISKILMYRSNWYTSSKFFHSNFYVDISSFWKIKEKAIKCHQSEFLRTNKNWLTFWKHEAENQGLKIGKKYAEVFQMVKWVH